MVVGWLFSYIERGKGGEILFQVDNQIPPGARESTDLFEFPDKTKKKKILYNVVIIMLIL